MSSDVTDDPLLTIQAIALYASVGAGEVRRDMKRAGDDPRRLAGVLHRGKLKARRSEVNAWIERNAQPAA